MPFWKRKGKDASTAAGTRSKFHAARADTSQQTQAPIRPRWVDAWARTEVEALEVYELLHVCNQEMKSRALDMPFLLLPFRPNANPSAAKNFIRSFFIEGQEDNVQYQGASLQHELRLIEPNVLCSIMKWCWSRLRGGVVGWNTYELFRTGETDSDFAKHAFDTFVPLSVESEARRVIVFDFFDLLAAVAAHGKTNGLGGRKLSRLAGWWAFAHSDGGNGFDGGYRSWASAADATSHLFFAYLRSRTPDEIAGSSGISQLPRSLLALVGQTEYPPETPALLQTSTPKVVMVVEKVSPTPYALLRRSRHFNFPQNEPCLETFSDYEDPLKALTIECRRVLDCVASENQSGPNDQFPELTKPTDSSWSNFQDLGFSSFGDNNQPNGSATRGHGAGNGLRSAPASGRHDHGRPITPSWADFLSSGFADDATVRNPASLRVPSEQMLPPLHGQRVQSSQSHVRGGMRDDNLDEAELGHVSRINLDETFWWVWMTSLAGEETTERKSVFGRCAFVETDIRDAHWLLMEEKVKGAVETPEEGVYIAEKKSRFTFGRKGRNRTDSSTGKIPNVPKKDAFKASSTPALAHHQPNPSQEAKVQAAAAEIVRQKKEDDEAAANAQRRARMGPDSETRTNSVMSLGMQPVLREEAGPAMQWARKFDKETIRSRYLGDPLAGLGNSRAASPASSMDLISAAKAVPDYERQHYTERQLPPTPPPEASTATLTAREEPSQSDGPILSQPQPIRPGPAPKMLDAPETSKQHRYNQSEMTMVSPDIQNQHHTLRKDVGSIDSTRGDHPALRQSAEEQTHSIQTTPEKQRTVAPAPPSAALPAPPMAPAAAAAAAAMRNMNAARPPPPPSKTEPRVLHKSKTGSTRKFKNLFSRKKADDQEPEALAMHRAINGASQKRKPVNKAEPSPMPQRDQEVSSPPAYSSAPVDHQAMAGSPEPDLPAVDDGEPGPEIETAPTPRGHSSGGAMHEYEQDYNQYRQDDGHEIHRQTQHGNQSSANFSNFSQGPLEDQPAFVGVDDEESEHHLQHNAEPTLHEQQNREEVTPTNSKPAHFNTGAAQRLFGGMQPANTEPETPNENYATPMAERDLRGDGLSSEQERPESGAPAPSVPFADAGDRWAQIRRNAAERRTEEPSGTSRGNRVSLPSQSGKTERTDDGETSGEETIEQRVARIRARVAQLTGAPERPTV